jgi:hypothetical protein
VELVPPSIVSQQLGLSPEREALLLLLTAGYTRIDDGIRHAAMSWVNDIISCGIRLDCSVSHYLSNWKKSMKWRMPVSSISSAE